MNRPAVKKHVLLIGDTSSDEFAAIAAWLEQLSHFIRFAGPDEMLAVGDGIPPPAVIIFAQSRPGQCSEAAVEALHRRWPLARLVALLGSWCEGETRTGRPCRGLCRIYWYDFQRRLSAFLVNDRHGAAAAWHLPRTATDAERLACELDSRTSQVGLVLIRAQSRCAYESLSDACQSIGYATDWLRTEEWPAADGVVSGIWDADLRDRSEWHRIGRFASTLAPAASVLAISFPRQDEWSRAAETGATVLAKPFQLPDLWHALRQGSRAASTIVESGGSLHPAICSTA